MLQVGVPALKTHSILQEALALVGDDATIHPIVFICSPLLVGFY